MSHCFQENCFTVEMSSSSTHRSHFNLYIIVCIISSTKSNTVCSCYLYLFTTFAHNVRTISVCSVKLRVMLRYGKLLTFLRQTFLQTPAATWKSDYIWTSQQKNKSAVVLFVFISAAWINLTLLFGISLSHNECSRALVAMWISKRLWESFVVNLECGGYEKKNVINRATLYFLLYYVCVVAIADNVTKTRPPLCNRDFNTAILKRIY